ncbi:hypothetical protein [Marinobacter sp. ATCH36]|uniref:hypothetical protein n=1 Tax=Marinobacter sp. ATCH36 TaxID=2945106 RepID=UPI002021B03A|nr:hypothetical protein [Marinobacter sp. ATCH36]MCL7944684.1 hypothetical protein [Marinobacter sp. ATCH36]
MTHKLKALPSGLVWLRLTATVLAWLLVVVFIHRLTHVYQHELVETLRLPMFRIAVTTLLLTALVYFIAVSLPWVPNPGFHSVCVVLAWVTLLVLGHSLSHMGFHDSQSMLSTMREAFGPAAIILLMIVYGLVLAMPFLPGVELGLLIMAVFGPTGALAAYVATLGGLMLAYAVGRSLPERVIMRWLGRIGVVLPHDRIASATDSMVSPKTTVFSTQRRLAATLLNHRYLSLAVCLNFPGNAALGGGGGVALLCGMSRQFSWWAFTLTLAITISPVPILVLSGLLNTEPLMEHHGFLHDGLTHIERLFVHD